MGDLVVVRIDRKRIPLERRAAFSTVADALSESLYLEARAHGEDVVVLSTCERFEVYFTPPSVAVDALLLARPLVAEACARRDDAGMRHLFRVAAGLESRIPGESHVLGQVRGALEEAQRRGTANRGARVVFRNALECGRRVRATVPFAAAAAGYTANAVHRLRAELGTLEGRHVLVVGTGALAADVARSLRDAGVSGLTIAGRHEARVAHLAQRFAARALTIATLHSVSTCFDAVVTALSVADPIVGVETLRTCHTDLLIDLGASPNVDIAVRSVPGVRVFGLDELGGVAVAASTIARAADIVERELARCLASHRRATTSPVPFPAAS